MFDKHYQYFSKVFLELILTDNQFKLLFQAFAPEIFADIESFSKNKNCSCKSKIENFILENRDKSYNFITNYIKNNNINLNLQAIEEKYKTTLLSGRTVIMKKNQWYVFSESLKKERAIYKSFSILTIDEETIEVYFL
jgi:hypothetical protein